jgi:nucleoid-associated protein YgaU
MKILNIFLIIPFISNSLWALDYIDKNGDQINQLDTERRQKIEKLAIKPNHVYDDEVQIESSKSNVTAQVLQTDKSEFGEYIVGEGDQLKSISQKLYGSTKKWRELLLLNEDKIKNNVIYKGMKLKYKLPQQEKN